MSAQNLGSEGYVAQLIRKNGAGGYFNRSNIVELIDGKTILNGNSFWGPFVTGNTSIATGSDLTVIAALADMGWYLKRIHVFSDIAGPYELRRDTTLRFGFYVPANGQATIDFSPGIYNNAIPNTACNIRNQTGSTAIMSAIIVGAYYDAS